MSTFAVNGIHTHMHSLWKLLVIVKATVIEEANVVGVLIQYIHTIDAK